MISYITENARIGNTCVISSYSEVYDLGGAALTTGMRLKALREKKQESLQQTADAVNTSKAHIWQIERGQADNPAIGVLKKLANHFDVSVAYLIGEQLDASDAEPELAGMFRQASEFTPDERELLKAMIKTLAASSTKKKTPEN